MRKYLGLFLSGILLVALVFAGSVFAGDDRPQKFSSLATDEVVDGDYFATGDAVEISGTVNGDVYAAAGTVLVDGTVNGDLLVAGGTVTISGVVTQDLRAAGGNITISGEVQRNITVIGGNIQFSSDAIISGDVVTAGGNVTIASPIAGSVNAGVGTMRLAPNARIAGDLNYWSDEDISIAEGATVSGELVKKSTTADFEAPSTRDLTAFATGANLVAKFASAALTFIIGFLLIRYFPTFANNASNYIEDNTLKSLGIGFLGLVLFPIGMIALMFTIIGIPVALVAAVMFTACLYIARLYAMLWIGRRIYMAVNKKAGKMTSFSLGLVTYYLLALFPIVGFFVQAFTLLAGFGAAIVGYKMAYTEGRKKNIF